jgi:PAS domain S-box-containing protein
MSEHERANSSAASSTSGEQREAQQATLEGVTAAWQETSDALRESERRYRELVEYSLGLICTHDLAGTILSINPAAAHSLGYRPEDGIGRNLREFLSPDKRDLFDEYLQRIREVGHDAGLMSVVAQDGSTRVWMYRNILSRGLDARSYVLGHAIDVTERVEAERTLRRNEEVLRRARDELEDRVKERTIALEEVNARLRIEIAEREEAERTRDRLYQEAHDANRLKDEFLSTLSHELRTPLNAIFGWARILRTRDLDAKSAHAVEVIERNAEAQVRLIEEVLDVSRIVTGKMALAMEPTDIRAVVRATIDTVRPAMRAKQIRFEEDVVEDLPMVYGDAHRLQQVFWNLLSNAVKFTNHGTITLTGRLAPAVIEFEIKDTGIGIGREVLPFVFDRFRQADSSTTRMHGGLGLGLAIVRHIVELHGGSVHASSAGPGHGATFTIQLPIAEQGEAMTPEHSHPTRSAGLSGQLLRDRRVLVVEDHADARDLVVAVLESAGARVVSTSTARDAMTRAREARPDVLITDLGLPGEDGYALLGDFRKICPEVPAIALTAYARASDRDRALAAGFARHSIKPVDPRQFVELVASLLT